MYLGHIVDEEDVQTRLQPLKDHLIGTAEQASLNAKSFNNSDSAYLCGMLHDIGKYSERFQKRIKEGASRCDHTTAGARVVTETLKEGKIYAYCIAGHHSGLQNIGSRSDIGGEGTLYGRLAESYRIPDYENYEEELPMDIKMYANKIRLKLFSKQMYGFSISFYIRMLYSALVDADFVDTEAFMQQGVVDRSVTYEFSRYHQLLETKLNSFKNNKELSKQLINRKRADISQSCVQMGKQERGLYSLTVPTGGGKTLSSMAFALEHAKTNKMDRIIYVIPFTSIIEQNANVFKELFGEEVVLEHHSNFDFDDVGDEKEMKYNPQKLQSENWDVPIVVTTNVQFFESLFANKSSKTRKLHNIANSVIIFDEVQMFPNDYLMPCVAAIAELIYNYNATAVLCSATQPSLGNKFPSPLKIKEICSDINETYKVFKRAEAIRRGQMAIDVLAIELSKQDQCLCIVNTRKHALELFEALKEYDQEGIFHLSTLMHPKHRSKKLSEIRLRLKTDQRCIVISTRLIEAGVDVDFPRVYRSMAGLDSIVQAGGRCNREGKLRDQTGKLIYGEIHVFESEEAYSKYQPDNFKREAQITRGIMEQHDDVLSPDAIEHYFRELYDVYLNEVGVDRKGILSRLNDIDRAKNYEFDFKDIARNFKMIEQNTTAIIILDEENKALLQKLEYQGVVNKTLRKLQPFTVSIYENEFNQLFGSGKLRIVDEKLYVLADEQDYDRETGLIIPKESGIGVYL